ncbi:uncharacterized protein LOC116162995 [Photinus pyralis]|uniref:Uncharacterized protein n=1 Tax=Photinus pyralis TaxID=7054 RepID=A0A1Y1LB44_PHOPY|nr:uncharacterized protein LOC116162995 [Photinus pyralis]
MVFERGCTGYNCNFHNVKFQHQPLPTFQFPTKSPTHTTSTTERSITEAVTSFVTETVQPSTTTQNITQAISEATTAVNEVVTNIIETTSARAVEVTNSFNEAITNAISTTTVAIDEAKQTINTIFETASNNFGNSGDGLNSTNTVSEAMENGTAVAIDTQSSTTPSTTESIISHVYSTTEELLKSMASGKENHEKFDYHPDHPNHSAIYIILGIILALLLLMFSVLIIVYIRHRKNKSLTLHHPYYEVSDKKDTSSVSIENEAPKECVTTVNDIYVQYSC